MAQGSDAFPHHSVPQEEAGARSRRPPDSVLHCEDQLTAPCNASSARCSDGRSPIGRWQIHRSLSSQPIGRNGSPRSTRSTPTVANPSRASTPRHPWSATVFGPQFPDRACPVHQKSTRTTRPMPVFSWKIGPERWLANRANLADRADDSRPCLASQPQAPAVQTTRGEDRAVARQEESRSGKPLDAEFLGRNITETPPLTMVGVA